MPQTLSSIPHNTHTRARTYAHTHIPSNISFCFETGSQIAWLTSDLLCNQSWTSDPPSSTSPVLACTTWSVLCDIGRPIQGAVCASQAVDKLATVLALSSSHPDIGDLWSEQCIYFYLVLSAFWMAGTVVILRRPYLFTISHEVKSWYLVSTVCSQALLHVFQI